jgi:nicotinamide riboside kinase
MKLKVAFTGPESSGKTTISRRFADLMDGIWVGEFAREYLQDKQTYDLVDLDKIAKGQMEKWHIEGELIVADTDITVIKIWTEYRFKTCSNFIQEAYYNQKFDHYFLCRPDMPWEEDPLRENPNERDQLFEIYHDELIKMNRPFSILEGNVEERLTSCKNVIRSLKNKMNS